jgi:hypothetical protein
MKIFLILGILKSAYGTSLPDVLPGTQLSVGVVCRAARKRLLGPVPPGPKE